MRTIGMDTHCVAADVVALQDGTLIRLGHVPMLKDCLRTSEQRELSHDDYVVTKITGNAASLADLLVTPDRYLQLTNADQSQLCRK